MSGAGHDPAGGRARRIDREALPDPALLHGRNPHARSARRIALAAAALVAVAAGAAVGLRGVSDRIRAARRSAASALDVTGSAAAARSEPEPPPISPSELAALQKSWVGSESIAPRAERLDPATGERVLPFHGFGLQIDTTPPGASVLVNGEEMGTSPLLTTVSCQPGDAVEVRAALGGRRAIASTRCRKDQLVKVALPLGRAR